MELSLFLQYLFAGITYGIIYAIVAIGFNIIYNTTGIINFAQGEFLMLGGMISISLLQFMPLPLAIAAAVIITMLVGALIEIIFIRWIENPSVLRMIIITIGISILIREAALHIWGESVRALPYFIGSAVTSVAILGTRISPQVLMVIGVCSIMVAVPQLFFQVYLPGPGNAGLCGKPEGGNALRHQCQEHGDLFLHAVSRHRRPGRSGHEPHHLHPV